MPKRTNPFQELVLAIERLLAKEDVQITSSVEMPEPGEGSEREMDVLVEGEINGESVRIAVEARDHQEPQDVTWIDALIGKYQLLQVDVVIAVSRSGFTAGAKQKASLHNIRTLTVKELEEGDWPSGFTRFGFRFLERGVQLVGFMLGVYPEPPKAEGQIDGNQPLVDRSGAPAGTLEPVSELTGAVLCDCPWL